MVLNSDNAKVFNQAMWDSFIEGTSFEDAFGSMLTPPTTNSTGNTEGNADQALFDTDLGLMQPETSRLEYVYATALRILLNVCGMSRLEINLSELSRPGFKSEQG